MLRSAFDFAKFRQLLDNTFHDLAALFDVRHLATAEHDRDLHFVPVSQKSNRLLDLEVDIVLTRFGTQPNFLQLGLMLLAAFLGPFAFLVLEFAKIHDSTNRRFGLRCDLDKVQPQFTGFFQSDFGSKDTKLFSVGINNSNGGNLDVFIDTRAFLIDLLVPPLGSGKN